MSRLRRLMVAVALLSPVPALVVPADAQPADYPSRPIKIIVCLPAGGGVDTVTRIISEKLQRRLGQPIVIENKGGQSGNIGAEAVFNADPDGYTLLASQPAPITTNPLLYRSMSFDPARFTPVAVMTRIPNTLTVRSGFPAKTVQEFIAYAKANPGKISYGSQGNGTTSHLTGVMFEQATGAKLLHVPYRGTAPAINDLMGGHVDVLFNELATSMEMHKSGRARILAVTTPQRVPDLPDIPTMQEAGLAGFESDTWNAISAPPMTPLPIVAKLNTAINEVLGAPEMQARLKALHLQPAGGTTAQMAEIVKRIPSAGAISSAPPTSRSSRSRPSRSRRRIRGTSETSPTPALERIVRGIAQQHAALLGAVERPFAVVEARAGFGDVAGKARVLRALVAVDEHRDVPGLLLGERIAQAVGHVGADEGRRRRDRGHAGAPVVGVAAPTAAETGSRSPPGTRRPWPSLPWQAAHLPANTAAPRSLLGAVAGSGRRRKSRARELAAGRRAARQPDRNRSAAPS